MKNVLLIFFFLFSLTFSQKADFNFNRIYYGNEVNSVTARSLGLGGAGLSGGAAFMALTHNPALAVKNDNFIAVNSGSVIYNLEEDRAFPYYDSFGDFQDYGSYFFQDNWYFDAYGQVNVKLPFEKPFNLNIAVGYLPFIDFNYDYFEEVRGISFGDPLLAYNTIKSSGQIYAIPLVIGADPIENLAIGFGASVLNGSVEYLERVESKSAQTAGIAVEYETKAELTNMPVLFNLGAIYQINERWGITATYRSAYSLETENTYRFLQLPDKLFSENTLDYPGRIGIGTNYRFENILAAQIFVDYYYEFWSDFKDDLNPQLSFEDTYTINLGIEHIFFDGLPFRVGFSYGSLRESRDFSKSVISAGSGFTLESVTFNIAAGFSSLEFFQDDIYDNANYGLETREQPDRVRLSELFGRLDVSFYLQ